MVTSDAEILAAAARDLMQQMRPDREFQLPLPPGTESRAASPDANISVEKALNYLQSLEVDPVDGGETPDDLRIRRAIGTHDRPAGAISRGPFRRDEQGSSRISLLGDRRGSAHGSGDFDRSSGVPPGGAMPVDAPSKERTHTADRLNVFVQLADVRALFEECLEVAVEKQAPKYRAISVEDVKRGFWLYGNERRAADPSLRSPQW